MMDSIGHFECDTILLLLVPTLTFLPLTHVFSPELLLWFKISFPQEREDPSSMQLDDEDFEDDDDSDRLGNPLGGDIIAEDSQPRRNSVLFSDSGSSNMGNSCDHLRMGFAGYVMCVFLGARITVSNTLW